MDYERLRQEYKPGYVRYLLIAESPPPAPDIQSSRHFYRSEKVRRDDRLFVNTIKALYPEATAKTEAEIEPDKERWLRRFQKDGWYMIETLNESQPHEVTKQERQQKIAQALPELLSKLKALCAKDTKIILIKSNVFEVVAEPLREAGFTVLNTALIDYPGRFNQKAYREKLAKISRKL